MILISIREALFIYVSLEIDVKRQSHKETPKYKKDKRKLMPQYPPHCSTSLFETWYFNILLIVQDICLINRYPTHFIIFF